MSSPLGVVVGVEASAHHAASYDANVGKPVFRALDPYQTIRHRSAAPS
jgi:hypothetical protein